MNNFSDFLRISSKILFSILIVSFLVLSGCSEGSSDSKGTSSSNLGTITGTQGISIRFLDNMPPDKLYLTDDTPQLPVTIEVRNLGTYSLSATDLLFSFGGADPSLLTLPSPSTSAQYIGEELTGKTQYLPEGGFTMKELGSIVMNRDNLGKEYTPTLLLSAYYKYQTKASVPVCIDPKSYDPNIKDRVCTVKDVSLSGGQGAPIAVSKVEQIASPSKSIFKLYFSNVGSGTVFYNANSLDNAVRNGISVKDNDMIKVGVTIGGNALDCKGTTGEDLLRVNDVLYCTYEYEDRSNAFSTVINVEIDYYYKTSIQKSMSIVNINVE